MSSKPKNKNFIILEVVPYNKKRFGTICGRHRVGARNEKEVLEIIKKKLGKHKAFTVYYEDKKVIVEHGQAVKDIWI